MLYKILDHKLGLNPNPKFVPTTDFADELQRRTQILIDSTKKLIMQSYSKYKEYYDRKVKAAPTSKSLLFHITTYSDCAISSNKTQILHHIRLRKYEPNNRTPYYRIIHRKAICNLMLKLLLHRMISMSSCGKQILENFLI